MFSSVPLHHLGEDVPNHALAGDGDTGLAVDFEGFGGVVQFIVSASSLVDVGLREGGERDAVDVDAEGAHPLAQRAHFIQVRVALVGNAGHVGVATEVDGVGAEGHFLAQPLVS